MRKSYPAEMQERAEHLYYCGGHSLKMVAGLMGVSLKTVKRWSVTHGWVEKRRAIDRAQTEIRMNAILLRQKLLAQCLESFNPREAIAALTLDSLIRKNEKEDEGGRDAAPAPATRCSIQNDQEAAETLDKAFRIKINQLSLDPGRLTYPVLKILRETMELADGLRKRGLPEEEERGGLTDEAAREIRMKILGLSD